MIFSIFKLTLHIHDRMSSITRVLHSTTWVYFTSRLPVQFSLSQEVVREAIMTDVNDLVQEFWGTSNDGVDGAPLFAMLCLHDILQNALESVDVRFVYFLFCGCVDSAETIYRN